MTPISELKTVQFSLNMSGVYEDGCLPGCSAL